MPACTGDSVRSSFHTRSALASPQSWPSRARQVEDDLRGRLAIDPRAPLCVAPAARAAHSTSPCLPLRTRWRQPASTTSAMRAVPVRTKSWTIRRSSDSEQMRRAMLIGLGLQRVLANDIESAQLTALHRLEHLRQMPALFRRHLHVPMLDRTWPALRRSRRAESLAADRGARPCRRRPARCSDPEAD